MKRTCLIIILILSKFVVLAQTEPDVKPPAARGLYAIWYEANKDVLNLPYIKGGQIVLQWAEVEPTEGHYDFSAMDEKLKQFYAEKRMTTIQVNGNEKPVWMYDVLPLLHEKLSTQIKDDQGTLMYWHPRFITDYSNFVKAYANHLKQSPYLSVLAGVRMNFNALGTEQVEVPAANRSLDQWIVPKGGTQGTAFTDTTVADYQNRIAEIFINAFDGINLFLRNNISLETENKFKQKFLDGKLMLFHTSSEIEPRSIQMEHNYDLFKKYGRTGHTLAYAESWADSWGNHGGKQDPRWTSPAQYAYWRMLSDLNAGVSLIAVYSNDLRVALNGTHPKEGDVSKYRESFDKTFRFASMYAGYHASPSVAPGAWVAFRHNESNINYKPLKEFTDNYTFLMTQLLPDNTVWEKITAVGPPMQRFGAWAKVLLASKTIKVQMSPVFAKSLTGKAAVVRIIYLDDKNGSFKTACSGKTIETNLTGTGEWKTLEIPIDHAQFTHDASGADITLTALSGNITFHLVNVERGNGVPNDVTNIKTSGSGSSLTLSWKTPADYDVDHINIYKNSTLLNSIPSTDLGITIKNVNKKSDKIRITTVDEAGRESEGIVVKM